MSNHKTTPHLILASQSPRRKDLLEQAGLTFTVIPGNFDEGSIPLDEPKAYAMRLAKEKANQIAYYILVVMVCAVIVKMLFF